MNKATKIKLKKAWNSFRDNFIEIIVALVIVAVLGVIVFACLKNESNRISEGTIVHKEYTNAWTSYGSENSPPRYHPAECSLTISGEKNGKYVEYTFDVPESEYVMYNVGDHYPKTHKEEN